MSLKGDELVPKLGPEKHNSMDSQDLSLLQSIFTSAAEGIIIVNKRGEIVLANPRAEKMFGYGSDEFLQLTIEGLLPERYRGRHPQHRDSFFQKPKSRTMGLGLDLWALRKNGSEFPVEISLSSFQSESDLLTVAFIIDITLRREQERKIQESQEKIQEYASKLEYKVKERTYELEHLNLGLQSQVQERKMAESALLETQKLYNAIAQNFPNGIIAVLDLDLNYIFVDGAEMHLRQWEADELIGRPYFSHFGNRDHLVEELEALRKDGREFSKEVVFDDSTYQVHGVPLYDEDDDLFQLLLVEENITKQKKAEEEIRVSLAKARDLNELKSRFVSMASHEFRTPLSTILSSISLIGKYPNDARDKRDKHIVRIKSAITNMTNILNDFLSIGKLEEGKIACEPEWLSLCELIGHIKEELEGNFKAGQQLVYQNGDVRVFADPKLLKNVFLNLISNAIKYSNEGSAINIDVKDGRKNVKIDVVDHGIGIPTKEQSNIFTRFYRAGNVTNIQGTGLGLHIVKKYVELMHGEISFTSKLNVGTTFSIALPNHEKENTDH